MSSGSSLGRFPANCQISGRAGPLYVSRFVLNVGLAERNNRPSGKAASGHGSRVRPVSSARNNFHPLLSRLNSVHRQLLSGLQSFSVSRPLTKTSSPIRTRHVEPLHHIGPAPLLAGS